MPRNIKIDPSKVNIDKLQTIYEKNCVTRQLKPSDITPNPYNKNKMGKQYFDALKAALADPEVGFTAPIMVCDHFTPGGAKYMVIDGEHRWRAAKELGYDTVPCYYFGKISESKLKFLMIAQNKIHGETPLEDIKEILESVEELIEQGKSEWDPDEGMDVWARAIEDEPADDADKYGLDDNDQDTTSLTVPITLFFNEDQVTLWRKVTGQVRLSRGFQLEPAVDAIIQFVDQAIENEEFKP